MKMDQLYDIQGRDIQYICDISGPIPIWYLAL